MGYIVQQVTSQFCNEKKWASGIIWVNFDKDQRVMLQRHQTCRCMCIPYLRDGTSRNTLWENCKPAEAVKFWEILQPSIHVNVTLTLPPTKTLLQHKSWQPNSVLAVASFSRIICSLPHKSENLLLMSCCQMPQHTFRDLGVEFNRSKLFWYHKGGWHSV